MIRRICAVLLSISFLTAPSASYAQGAMDALGLPLPGAMVATSPLLTPPLLKGIIVDVNNPLAFRFVVDSGKTNIPAGDLRKSVEQQAKYFLTGLTVDPKDLWVNLSPYEQDRMVPEALGKTDLGRDMLAQDYLLKQLSASIIHPDKDLGKDFWARVYAQAKERFGTTDIPVDTFNKIWIMPDDAVVFEEGARGYITKATLKVLLEEDYLALEKGRAAGAVSAQRSEGDDQTRALTTQVMREVVLPAITKEVNEGANFAPLRQIYHALVLAKWYKETVSNQLLAQVYFGKEQVDGVELADQSVREGIYQRYVEAYKTGVFNYIKEETDLATGTTSPRKYFSGGENFDFSQMSIRKTADRAEITQNGDAFIADIDLASSSGDEVLPEEGDRAQNSSLQGLMIQALIRKVEAGTPLSSQEMNVAYEILRDKGLPFLERAVKKMGLLLFFQSLSFIEQFDPNEYVHFDQDPSSAEVRTAQYVIAQLSNSMSTHQMSHLAHPAVLVSFFLPSADDQLSVSAKNRLKDLHERAKKIEKDNHGIKGVLGGFSVYGRPSLSVFLLRKIRQHIKEAKETIALILPFMEEEHVSPEYVDMMKELVPEEEATIKVFEDQMDRLEKDDPSSSIKGINFSTTVKEVVETLKKDYGLDITFTSSGGLAQKAMFFSYYDLHGILEVLVDNARQAARPGVPLQIHVSVEYMNDEVILNVQDNGTGMNVTQLSKIRAQEAFTTKGALGSGQGLKGVREAVGFYSGSLEATSLLGQGTTFTLRFPIDRNSDSAMGVSALALAAVPVANIDFSSSQTVLALGAVFFASSPFLFMAVKHWATEHYRTALRKTQSPIEFVKAVTSLRHFANHDAFRDELVGRYMDMNPGIRTATRVLAHRFGYTDLLSRWLESRNIISQLAHPNQKVRDSAKALMSQFQLTSLERAEACFLTLEREINKSTPASSEIVQENLLDLFSFRKKAYIAAESRSSQERSETNSFDRKAVYVITRILGWGPEDAFDLALQGLDLLAVDVEVSKNLYRDIIEGAPKVETRLAIFRRLSPQDQKDMANRLWDLISQPNMLFDVSVEFLLKSGFTTKKILTDRVLEVLRKNHYIQDPLRAPHIRALDFLGIKGFSNVMSQRQFEKAINEVEAPQDADMAMGSSALFVMATAYADPAVIDRVLGFLLEDHLQASIGVAGIAAVVSVTGLAALVRKWNAQAYRNLLNSIRYGSVDSRIKALIEFKGLVTEGEAYTEFLNLINDPAVVLTPQQKESLEKGVFLFGMWLARDIPLLLIDPSKDVRDHARKLLRDKVSLREQGEAYMWAIQREFMRLSNTRHDYEANPVLLELIDDMLSIRGELSVRRDLDKKFEKVLLSILPDSGIVSMEKIRDAVVTLRAGLPTSDINRAIVRGTVDAEFSKRFLSRLESPLPIVNVEDVVLFLLHTETAKPARIRSLVLGSFRERWQQMDQSLRNNYLSTLALLGTEGVYPEMDQEALKGFFGIDKAPFAALAPSEDPVDPAMISIESLSIISGTSIAASAGLAFFVRYWNAKKYQQLLERVRKGGADSRIDALIEFRKKASEEQVFNEFIGLLGDASFPMEEAQYERLRSAGFNFDEWLTRIVAGRLVHHSLDLRRRGAWLSARVPYELQKKAYFEALKRETKRYFHGCSDEPTSAIFVDLMSSMMELRIRERDGSQDLEIQKILLEAFPKGDLAAMRKIRDFLVRVRYGYVVKADGVRLVNEELATILLQKIQQPPPVVNIQEIVRFLMDINMGDPAWMRAQIYDTFRNNWEKMDFDFKNAYVHALKELKYDRPPSFLRPDYLKEYFSSSSRSSAKDMSQGAIKGGIDVSGLDVTRTGKGIQVSFDPAMLTEFAQGTFKGFRPVIVGITPASNLSSALGL